jgi:FAD/FMN-containing dehydrogenase
MYVKLIQGSPSGGVIRKSSRERTFHCDHVQATHHSDGPDGVITSITIEIVPAPKELPTGTFTIPDDAENVYITNDKGDTIDRYSLKTANATSETQAQMKVAK